MSKETNIKKQTELEKHFQKVLFHIEQWDNLEKQIQNKEMEIAGLEGEIKRLKKDSQKYQRRIRGAYKLEII